MPRKPIDLPQLTGTVPFDLERTVEILRDHLEFAHEQIGQLNARLASMPPPLTLDQIQQALSATGSNPLQTAALLNTNPPSTVPPPPTPEPDGIPDHQAIVQAVATAQSIGPATSDAAMFVFIRTVVQQIIASGTDPPGLVCGQCLGPFGGAATFTCLGITYRYARVCYSNGHVFDVLIDGDPGGARTPQWADNGIDLALYAVAVSPGSAC